MVITASDARAKLFPLIEQVTVDAKPVFITSKNGNAVLISESEYESMIEMSYLMSSPENRKVIDESLAEITSGKTKRVAFPFLTSVAKNAKKTKA